MEKLKDFIYDKNDILVALLVLVVAAAFIWWRMDAIMEYPEKIFSAGDQPGTEQDVDGNPSGGEAGDGPQSGGDGQGQAGDGQGEGQGQDGQGGEGGDDGTQTGSQTTSLWQGGALTRDVEVDVYGNSATAAVQCLVDAGLFEDYDEYREICDNTGLNHEKVSAGSLLFEKGSTKEDVAKKINWS